jgi:hypothetical protein
MANQIVPADINSQVVFQLVEQLNALSAKVAALEAAANFAAGQTAMGLLTTPKTIVLYPSTMPAPAPSFPVP